MNDLHILQKRIKGSRIYKMTRANKERLYLPIGKRNRLTKTSAWFEVVNDRIAARVIVDDVRDTINRNARLEEYYLQNIQKQFHEIINDCELERKKIPLHKRLRDDIIPVYENSLKHQADALRFMCSMKVSALFADTGTGKSKIVIDLCNSRYEAGQISKVLAFLPVSTKKNFRKEVEKWSDNDALAWKFVGLESISSSDRIYLEALDWIDNDTQLIVDESHKIKNPIAKRSKRVKKIAAKCSYKVVMTGTPVTENVHNLYMQYAVLSDLIIDVPNWLKFEEKYMIMGGVNGDEVIGYKNIDYLMGLLEPYTYQIAKEEATKLPAKIFDTKYCGLNADQTRFYEDEKIYLLDLIQNDYVRATDIFEVFGKMQQIASGYYKRRSGAVEWLGSHKPKLLEELDLSQKTVFFCKYLFEVDMLVDLLGSNKCSVFTGTNAKERDAELEQFVEGNKMFFVATMQSGGTGLNGLQTASCQIVFYSNSFSYFQRKQSIGRIDRQGQTREMKIIDFVTNSGIDDRIIKNLARKSNLADEIKELLKDKTKLKQYIEKL